MESIEQFLKDQHISEDGFADHSSVNVTISANADALEVSNLLGIDVNNTIDILYYFQRSQNSDGGFGSSPGENSSFEVTVDAIRGLRYLPVNSSQLQNWEIFTYVNQTASKMLFENISKTTGYREGARRLTYDLIPVWYKYITASFSLGFLPKIDTESLVQQLQEMQLNNGSYPSFQVAIDSILLLGLIGSAPRDPDLATKFILAFTTENGAFTSTIGGEGSLESSYRAVLALNTLDAIDRITYKDALTRFVLGHQLRNSGFYSEGGAPTVHDTLMAVTTLHLLKEFDELRAPDVLQTVGFISFPSVGVVGVSLVMVIVVRRRRS